jgi:predicted metal-dependent peptidase
MLQELADRIAAGKVIASRQEPYLAPALHALTLNEAPSSNTVSVDRWWRLYVDPSVSSEWTAPQWATVLRSEARRLLLGHPDRADALNASDHELQRFALASNATVNSDTERSGSTDWPSTPILSEQLPGGRTGMAVEEVYVLLLAQNTTDEHLVYGSGASGKRQIWENPDFHEDGHALSEAKASLLARQIAELATASGKASPALTTWAQNLLTPQLDWRRVLDSHVRSVTGKMSGRRDYTYTRPSRRSSPYGSNGGVVLAGMCAPEPPRVVVIRDTSYSMGDLISDAADEIDGMLASRARVTLIDTDSEAHGAVRLQRRGAASNAEGGGSTDMGAGLEAAAKLRPRPHLAVVLTDGMTPWPERNPLRSTPVLVVVLGADAHKYAKDVPSWATTVTIPTATHA